MPPLTAVQWKVQIDGGSTSAVYEPAVGTQVGVFVCAHGAGGSMNDRGLVKAAESMRSAGLGVVRFNFPYAERKSGRPDPMPILESCVAGVVAHTRQELQPATLIIGGRSMGGRAASMLAAAGFDANGLLLLAYPLHPPGQHDKLRDAHLPSIAMPVLCLNGTRDPFCSPELMKRAVEKVRTTWTMHWIDGADHSFRVPKSTGRTDADVFAEVTAAARAWLQAL
jgi:predicted alpha/beta-hydrolase family hydrolase